MGDATTSSRAHRRALARQEALQESRQSSAATAADAEPYASQGPGDWLIRPVLEALGELVASHEPNDTKPEHEWTLKRLHDLFETQVASRWLEVISTRLSASDPRMPRCESRGEAMAALGLAARLGDPAILRWRTMSFGLGRATEAPGDPVGDLAAALSLAKDAPMSRGRYPIGGNPTLNLIATTAQAAQHLPRAVGMAWAMGRSTRMKRTGGYTSTWDPEAITIASFGAEDLNSAHVLGSLNAVQWALRWRAPMPLLLVCEEASRGHDPKNWAASKLSSLEGIEYASVDAAEADQLLVAADRAVDYVRTKRRPYVLHIRSGFDLSGHPDADNDPLLGTLNTLMAYGADPQDLWLRFEAIRERIEVTCGDAALRARITSLEEVTESLWVRRPQAIAKSAVRSGSPEARSAAFDVLPEHRGRLTLADTLSATLIDAAVSDSSIVLMGPELMRMGRPVTDSLHATLGTSRVVYTVSDPSATLGLAMGAASSGYLPIVDLGSLELLHEASALLRDEAALLGLRSGSAQSNPMVIRVSAWSTNPTGTAEQQGLAFLRDIPGLKVLTAAHPGDAASLLRTAIAVAREERSIAVVVEPSNLYRVRDMLAPADDRWCAPYAAPEEWSPEDHLVGRAQVWGVGSDLTLATFGPGVRTCLRVADRLASEGLKVRVLDLRWLSPLPVDDVVAHAQITKRLLVVDPSRRSGGVSESVVAAVLESGFNGRMARINVADVPLLAGPAASLGLLNEEDIVTAARHLCV